MGKKSKVFAQAFFKKLAGCRAEPYGLDLDLKWALAREKRGKQGLCPAFPGRRSSFPLSHGYAVPAPPRGEPSKQPTRGLQKAKSRLPLWGALVPSGHRSAPTEPAGESAPAGGGEGEVPAAPSHGLRGSAGILPTPLTNAAERGTIEIEKESLPVRRLAQISFYLRKSSRYLAGATTFSCF